MQLVQRFRLSIHSGERLDLRLLDAACCCSAGKYLTRESTNHWFAMIEASVRECVLRVDGPMSREGEEVHLFSIPRSVAWWSLLSMRGRFVASHKPPRDIFISRMVDDRTMLEVNHSPAQRRQQFCISCVLAGLIFP
jgi:hypothetical protein